MKAKKRNSKIADSMIVGLTLMTVHLERIKPTAALAASAATSTVTLGRPWPNFTRTCRAQKRWPTKPWPC